MSRAKTITVQAATPQGSMVYARTVQGKALKLTLLREALEAVHKTGGVIRYQTHGARDWARWIVVEGGEEAHANQAAVWPC